MRKSILNLLLFLIVLAVLLSAAIYFAVCMPGEGTIAQLQPLDEWQNETANRLRAHVEKLAGEIGERHYQTPDSYAATTAYIESSFVDNRLTPYIETFGNNSEYSNIVAEIYGTTSADEIIIIGAHYDTVWLTPGADDNASGVAVLLELAGRLQQNDLKRTLRFVAFANEEHPHFLTKNMGSLFHAKRSRERGDNIKGMISLEMLGYYSDKPGSQRYPRPLNLLYPSTANFIAFVGNIYSRSLLRESIRLFRETRAFPSEGLAVPVVLVPDVRRSDQAAFWNYGIKAFMITDTAAYRNPNYHNVSDVPNSLDYESMARVVTGLEKMILGLAE